MSYLRPVKNASRNEQVDIQNWAVNQKNNKERKVKTDQNIKMYKTPKNFN